MQNLLLSREYIFSRFITLLLLRNKKYTGQELTLRRNLMKQSHLTLKVSLKTQLLLTITVIQAANEIKFVQAKTNIQMYLTMIISTTVWEMHIFCGYSEINTTRCHWHTKRLTVHSWWWPVLYINLEWPEESNYFPVY
jgi:hypothetical protein